jgi:hypothetical protein
MHFWQRLERCLNNLGTLLIARALYLSLLFALRRLLGRRLRLNRRLCFLTGLAGAVYASGSLQVGRPGQPRKMFSTSMLVRKELGREMKARAWHSLKAL